MGPGRGCDITQDGYGLWRQYHGLDISDLTDYNRLTLTYTPLSSPLGEELKINTMRSFFTFLTIGGGLG